MGVLPRRNGIFLGVAGAVCGLLLLNLAVPSVFASIFGTVRGIVHDSQHRPIEGAAVTLVSAQSDWHRDDTTDDEGRFQIDAVPAGEYTIRITKDGFQEFTSPLTVQADSAPLLHFPLAVAGVNERVEVNANEQSLDTTSSSAPTTLGRSEIDATPGATRANSLNFITDYTPGAYMVHDQLHIRGGHQVSWLVDGVPVPNTNIAANVGPQFDPKDIDVIEIQRGGYSAEYGDRTYGVFNVIPRSGFERNREIELNTTYGSFHSTDSQISIGDHTDRFAYYTSVGANRTDVGLMPPEPDASHNQNDGVSGFTSLFFNATPKDQLRFVTSARADYFQIPNTIEQQDAQIRDVQRERDVFANFSWIRTASPGLLFTIAPFVHWNHAAYDGRGPVPSLLPDSPPIPTDHSDAHYEGGLVSLAATRGRHNAHFGIYGFAQQDDSRFGLVPSDGSGAALSQTGHPSGGTFSAFAEEQFRAADWLTLNGGLRFTHFSGGITEDKVDPRVGAALRIPRWNWVFRAFYGRYYQAPPLQTITGPLLQFAASQSFDFTPLHGETDDQREFGLTIPVRGWSFDFANFQTHALNFFDHDALGNSNIFFPLTLERARIHGWETTVRSPKIAKQVDFYLTYSNQTVQGAGIVTGGLLSDDTVCGAPGFCYLDHDQRNTLSLGFHTLLPWQTIASANLSYGSGFLNGDGPRHLPGHTEFDFSLAKSFGESFTLSFTAQNLNDSRYLLDNSNTFGGTHWNYPRQFTGALRYRFRF